MRVITGCLLLLMATLSWADIVAHYRNAHSPENNLTLYYRNDNQMRVDMGDDGYLLLSGQQSYLVRQENGQWQALNLGDMAKSAKQMMDAMGVSPEMMVPDELGADYQVKDTGRTETVAGLRGKVFQLTEQGETTEVVLTDNADLRRIFSAYLGLVERFGKELGVDSTLSPSLLKGLGNYQGLLRDDDGTALTKLEKVSKPASLYELPAGVKMATLQDVFNAPEVQQGIDALRNLEIPEGLPPEVQEQLRQLQQRR